MKKLFTTFCLVVIGLLATIPIRAEVGDTFSVDNSTYKIINEDLKEVSLISCSASGDVIVSENVEYNGIYYTITQIGQFISGSAVTNVFTNSLNSITIPNTVTEICYRAFAFNYSLKQVFFPDSLLVIGGEAFYECPNLTSIDLPASLMSIGLSAFGSCSALKDASIPGSQTILEGAIFNSSTIENLFINSKEIGNSWFSGINTLTKITLGTSVQSIGNSAFSSCSSLASVDFPSSLTSIGNLAFNGCSSLTSVEIPDSVISIGEYAFAGCSLSSIEIPNAVNSVGMYAFYNNGITNLSIPNSLNSIGWMAFGSNPIKSLTIDSKEIGEGWFSNTETLTSLILGNNVQSIGNSAFSGCSIASLEIPSSVTSIGDYAFQGNNITNLSLPNSLQILGSNVFSGNPIEKLNIDCKEIGENWFSNTETLTSLTLGNNVATIGNSAFSRCSIASLEIPSSLTSIGNSAFTNNKLTSITLPKSLQIIGSGAFYGCPIQTLNVNTGADINGVFSYNELTQAVFSDGATTIPSFSGASKLVNITLPSPMTSVPENAFTDCSSLPSIMLPPGIESIGNYAFSNCVNLTEIELPDAVTIIGSNAFSGCVSLSELEIPANVTSIGNGAFSGCSSLELMRLPENLTSISSSLFANCNRIEKVYFSENVNSFGASAFQNCTSLRSLIIPDGVETIPANLMNGCTSLTEILIPNSVETISANAFQGCSSLRNIDLGTGVYTIGDYAFADCPNITDIHSMALNPPIAESYTFPTKAYTNATVTVREQSLATYNRENPWYRFQNYLTVSGAISLSHYNVDMAGNEVFQLGVYGSDSEIVWSSSNPAVAYANDCGLIVAMGITGATVITATVDGEEINCNVTVSSPYRDPQAYTRTRAAVDEEELQPVDVIMEGVSGNPPMVNVRLVPVGSKTIIDWKSSDPALASVKNGIVTVHADGDVDFGVETENGLEETIEVDTKGIDNAGIEEIFQDADIMTPMNVYDLNGRIIYFNATLEQIKSLDKGLYIIKGKKVIIK
ncbi:MAG: leucine-rich repeat protein [Muribaculaceae bacterium]|nr:leucine-rich repeat protein [Muribaculaceae bacterium]